VAVPAQKESVENPESADAAETRNCGPRRERSMAKPVHQRNCTASKSESWVKKCKTVVQTWHQQDSQAFPAGTARVLGSSCGISSNSTVLSIYRDFRLPPLPVSRSPLHTSKFETSIFCLAIACHNYVVLMLAIWSYAAVLIMSVRSGVETVGIDPGQAYKLGPPFPNHAIILGAGRYGLASLVNLDRLPATGSLLIAAPLKIVGGSGSPIRAFALVPGMHR
jgi:hypothetical protein